MCPWQNIHVHQTSEHVREGKAGWGFFEQEGVGGGGSTVGYTAGITNVCFFLSPFSHSDDDFAMHTVKHLTLMAWRDEVSP